MRLILASGSPQRRKLLRSMGLSFKVVPSGVGENAPLGNWRKMVKDLARRKARAVAKRHPDAVVVGADTVVVCRGRLYLKPRDRAHSIRILGALNGRWHRVYTGVAVVCRSKSLERADVAVSRVRARELPRERLESLAGKHMDKSGAYAVQDKRDPFIQKVVGPIDNVIGFPRRTFSRLLRGSGLSRELNGRRGK